MQVQETISEDAGGLLQTASDKGLTESLTFAEMEVTRAQVIMSSAMCAADSAAGTTDDRELDVMLAGVLGSGQAPSQDAAPTVTPDTDSTAQAKQVRPQTDDRELDAMLANVLGSASGQASACSAQEAVPAVTAADTAQAQRTHSQTDDVELNAMLAGVLGGGQASVQAALPAVTAADTVSAAQAQQVQPQTESKADADAAEGAAAEKSAFHLPDSLFDSPLAAAGVSLRLWYTCPKCLLLCHDSQGPVVSLPWRQAVDLLRHSSYAPMLSTLAALQNECNLWYFPVPTALMFWPNRIYNCPLQKGQSINPFGRQKADSDNEDGGTLVKQPAQKNRCFTS